MFFLLISDYGLKTSLQCEHGEQLVTEDWLLKSNGYVHTVKSNQIYTHDEYCIDLTDDTLEPDPNWMLVICNETELWYGLKIVFYFFLIWILTKNE